MATQNIAQSWLGMADRRAAGLWNTCPPFFRQGLHRADEDLGAMRVVAEHVEARAGRREQHDVAGVGQFVALPYRLFQAGCVPDGNGAGKGGFDEWCVAADQDHGARTRGCGGCRRGWRLNSF